MVAKRGWYLNQGESLEGVTTLSAPFRWNTATYIVTIAGPSARLEPKLEQAVGLITNVCLMLETRPKAGGTGSPQTMTTGTTPFSPSALRQPEDISCVMLAEIGRQAADRGG